MRRTLLRDKVGRASAGSVLRQVPARRLAVRCQPSGGCQRDEHESPALSRHALASTDEARRAGAGLDLHDKSRFRRDNHYSVSSFSA